MNFTRRELVDAAHSEQFCRYCFAGIHLLSAVAAKTAIFVPLITERGGDGAGDARREGICNVNGGVVFRVCRDHRAFHALLVDHRSEKPVHQRGGREAIVREGRLQETRTMDLVCLRSERRGGDHASAKTVPDEMNAVVPVGMDTVFVTEPFLSNLASK